jgi:hypothetical protein
MPERPEPGPTRKVLESNIAWLSAVLAEARRSAAAAEQFGIFGTSISGMWLYGGLGEKISFFVDEDITRVGKSYDGIPVFAPSQVPQGSTVFVPLLPDVARRVSVRHAGAGVRYVEPPPYVVVP